MKTETKRERQEVPQSELDAIFAQGPFGTNRNDNSTFETSNGIFDEYGQKIERVNLCECSLCEVYLHKRDKLGRLYCEICNRLWTPKT